jgi:hypothetical protein
LLIEGELAETGLGRSYTAARSERKHLIDGRAVELQGNFSSAVDFTKQGELRSKYRRTKAKGKSKGKSYPDAFPVALPASSCLDFPDAKVDPASVKRSIRAMYLCLWTRVAAVC